MESLGSPADTKLKYTLLNQMVSELVKMPEMLAKLTIHYSNVTEQYPNDPDQLFAVLMDMFGFRMILTPTNSSI